MKNKKKLYGILAVILIVAVVFPVYGKTTQEEISETKAEKNAAVTELRSTQEMIAALESKKGESEAYLSEVSQQLADLTAEIESLREQTAAKQKELEVCQGELLAAEAEEDAQYEGMKTRIQYMYENSLNGGALEALFSAESFSDFLNRASQIEMLTQFDRDMLNSYSETVLGIEEKKQFIIKEQEELSVLQGECENRQDQLVTIYETTYREVQSYMKEIDEAQSSQYALVQQIQMQEAALNQLLILQKQEEAARIAAEEAARAAAAEAEARAAAEAASASSYEGSGSSEAAAEPVVIPDVSYTDTQESAPVESQETAPQSSGTYLGQFKLTAYCGCSTCCGQWSSANPTTASGAPAVQGVTVAMGGVDFGTKLLINGTVYTVQDRGTAYGHVDIYFNNHSDALRFGMQTADVYQLN